MTARTYHLTPPTGPVMRAVCGQEIDANHGGVFAGTLTEMADVDSYLTCPECVAEVLGVSA